MSQRTRRAPASPSADIVLSPASQALLETLWGVLDQDHNGRLNQDDFAALIPNGRAAMQTWERIRGLFDRDYSGDISPAEYIEGFMRLAMESAIDDGAFDLAPTTPLDGIQRINTSLNLTIDRLCRNLHQSVVPGRAVPVGPPSAFWGGDPGLVNFGNGQNLWPISQERLSQLEGLWTRLDTNGDGVLTIHDFLRALPPSRRTEPRRRAGDLWSRLSARLDMDGDGSITPEEFVAGFRDLALQSQLRVTSRPATHHDFLNRLYEDINSKVAGLVGECEREFVNLAPPPGGNWATGRAAAMQRRQERLEQRAAVASAAAACDCGHPERAVDGIHVCRYFGHFQCECGRRWKSPWCWRDTAVPEQCLPQQCQSCDTSTWPYQTDQLDGDGRLHVGAAVRVLSASDGATRPYVGETGRLVEDDQSDRPFKVAFDCDGEELWFMESELERVSVPHDWRRCGMCQRLGYDCSTGGAFS